MRTKCEEEKGEEQTNHIRIESRTYYHFQKLSLNYKSLIFFFSSSRCSCATVFGASDEVHGKACRWQWIEAGVDAMSMCATTYFNSSLDRNINSYFIALFSDDEFAGMRMCCSDFDSKCWMINNNNTHFCHSLLLKIQRALQLKQITLLAHTLRRDIVSQHLFGHMEICMEDETMLVLQWVTGFHIRAHFRRCKYSRSLLSISIQSSVNLNAIKYYMQTNLLFNGKYTNRLLYLSFVFYVWIKRAQACNGCHAIASIEQHTADALRITATVAACHHHKWWFVMLFLFGNPCAPHIRTPKYFKFPLKICISIITSQFDEMNRYKHKHNTRDYAHCATRTISCCRFSNYIQLVRSSYVREKYFCLTQTKNYCSRNVRACVCVRTRVMERATCKERASNKLSRFESEIFSSWILLKRDVVLFITGKE